MTSPTRKTVDRRATFDRTTGAVYVYVKRTIGPREVRNTMREDTAEVYLDYDANDRLVGVEVLISETASRRAYDEEGF